MDFTDQNHIFDEYDKTATILYASVKNVDTLEQKEELLENFTKKFTTIPLVWVFWKNILNRGIPLNGRNYRERDAILTQKKQLLFLKAKKHFHVDFNEEPKNIKLAYADHEYVGIYIEGLLNPHVAIQPCLRDDSSNRLWHFQNLNEKRKMFFKMHSSLPLNDKCFERFQKALAYIYKESGNLKGWMECLQKTENPESIIKNFEIRLGLFPGYKNLWKFYFEFCEKHCEKALLEAYRRYCRLFFDDFEIRQKYQQEISRILKAASFNASKWAIDLIEWERDFVSQDSANKLMINEYPNHCSLKNDFDCNLKLLKKNLEFVEEEEEIPENGNPKILTDKSFQTQCYAFHAPFMRYVIDKGNWGALFKFQNCCKHLSKLIQEEKTLIYNLFIHPTCRSFTFGHSIYISEKEVEAQMKKYKKINIGNTLLIYSFQPKIIEQLRSQIFECNFRILSILFQSLTFEEYKFLVNPVTLEAISIVSSIILLPNGQNSALENLMEKLGNIEMIWKAHAAKNSCFSFFGLYLENSSNLKLAVANVLEEWPENEKPTFHC